MESKKLSIDQRQELIDAVDNVRQLDPAGYVGVVAILCCHSTKNGDHLVSGYSRGTFKRAIRWLREAQRSIPQHAGVCEDAIAFIRREWLRREEGVA